MAKFFGRPIDEVSCDELKTYFQHPSVRRLSYASIAPQINSLAFLYKHVLKQPLALDVAVPWRKI
ncbi:phage integrase N-terminal SAM-like domain-containing protein [Glaciecola sp. SC05]|uniref:phage integrase N-terminal SAM-like domain-containing protein n=1 Tax=Glaciecola sp. SC05 TaxID=1987355 RepID=UPI003527DA18